MKNAFLSNIIGKYLLKVHGDKTLLNEDQFRVLKKYRGKFASFPKCFSWKNWGLALTLSDSISVKLFV